MAMNRKWLFGVAAVAVAALGSGAAWWTGAWGHAGRIAPAASTSTVVATVDGSPLSEKEVYAGGGLSAPRAQQVDDYLTKVVLAKAFERSGGVDADVQAAIDRSRREILFNAWVTRESSRIRAGLKDADLRVAYDKELTDDMFAKYRLSYVLSATAEEAASATTWKPLKLSGAQEWIPVAAVPYQLGTVVKTMKKGDATQTPIVTREGWLRIRVDDIQLGRKPALEEVKASLTEMLTTRALQARVQAVRGAADIRLK